MSRYSLSHLSDHALLHGLAAVVARERESTSDVLAHIAEVSARKLHLKAGYPSMTAYCLARLHLSEAAAAKRVRAALVARRFPVIFDMVGDGRLHLSGVVALARYLKKGNADELLSTATHKSRSEIEAIIACRYPRTDLLALVTAIPAANSAGATNNTPVEMAIPTPGTVPGSVPERGDNPEQRIADAQSITASSTSVAASVPTQAPGPNHTVARVSPLSTQSYAIQFTLSGQGHDLLRQAQDLLGHEIPSGDLAQVFEKALKSLVAELEKRKFAKTSNPRPMQRRESSNSRYIPLEVKRAVWSRDGGRCTYVSQDGHRCEARSRLEFDHVTEFARGGQATVGGIRLRCRAHNQYTAERAFGEEFMRRKREMAAGTRAAARNRASEPSGAERRQASEPPVIGERRAAG